MALNTIEFKKEVFVKKKKLFLYVGPHRSGSLFTRNHIFPYIEGVYSTYTRDPVINSLVLDAMEMHPLFVDPIETRRKILERLKDVEEETILISNEEFFGDYGHHNSDGEYIIQPFYDNPQRTELLFKIFDAPEFEPPKVMMSLRRQDGWVESAYMHFIHNYRIFKFDEFLAAHGTGGVINYSSRSATPGVDIKSLDWSVYLENYHRVFGAENVCVLPFEMGTKELTKYLDRLYDFMGTARFYPDEVKHVNRSLSTIAYRMACIFGPWVRQKENPYGFIPDQPFIGWIQKKRKIKDTKLLWFMAGISRRINLFWFLRNVVCNYNYKRPDHFGPERRQALLDYYKESNKKYAEMINVDLSKYGYY
jgi:hypothetical protein